MRNNNSNTANTRLRTYSSILPSPQLPPNKTRHDRNRDPSTEEEDVHPIRRLRASATASEASATAFLRAMRIDDEVKAAAATVAATTTTSAPTTMTEEATTKHSSSSELQHHMLRWRASATAIMTVIEDEEAKTVVSAMTTHQATVSMITTQTTPAASLSNIHAALVDDYEDNETFVNYNRETGCDGIVPTEHERPRPDRPWIAGRRSSSHIGIIVDWCRSVFWIYKQKASIC